MLFRNCCCLAVAAAWLSGTANLAAEEVQVTDTWVMQITPAQGVADKPSASTQAANAANAAATTGTSVNPADYARIYRSIPFNRAEYNANPNYRHDTTMEILTGNARHQTIVTNPMPRREPVVRDRPFALPWRYNSRARGLNYYFYYPYWNYRGIF